MFFYTSYIWAQGHNLYLRMNDLMQIEAKLIVLKNKNTYRQLGISIVQITKGYQSFSFFNPENFWTFNLSKL